MKIKKTRYVAVVAMKEGNKALPLFDEETGRGTSGEGKAFEIARKALKERGLDGIPFNVQRVEIEAEIDIAKAIQAGAFKPGTCGIWNIVKQ